MVIQGLRAVVKLARSVIPCQVSGLWHVVRIYVAGRNAVNFERERRTTLRTVSTVLSPGTEVYDSRADGSVLRVRVAPITHNGVMIGRIAERSTVQAALPPAGAAREGYDTHLSTAGPVEE